MTLVFIELLALGALVIAGTSIIAILMSIGEYEFPYRINIKWKKKDEVK